MTRRTYTMTGPGVEKVCPDGPGVALSAAITYASHATEPCTFYARDPSGASVGYAERDEQGIVTIRRFERP